MTPASQTPVPLTAGRTLACANIVRVPSDTTLDGLGLSRTAPERVGRYRVVRPAGRGGMGVVYEAYDDRLKRPVAVKMVRDVGPDDYALYDRFQTEAEAVAQLHHPNIVQIFEVGTDAGRPYVALEFLPGGSLQDKTGSAPQPPRAAADLVRTVAAAVHHAHQHGVVHRDLKPANILFDAAGVPKVTDFGTARVTFAGASGDVPGAALTRIGEVVGTPQYMAPEQARGTPDAADSAVDVYALGAVLYQLLTGRPPFDGPDAFDTMRRVISADPVPPRHRQPAVPRDLEAVCLRCLEKHPARRYPTAEAAADDLARFLAGEPTRARPTTAAGRAWKKARRRPVESGLVAAVMATALAGVAGITAEWRATAAAWEAAESNARTARVAEAGATAAKEVALRDRDAAAASRAAAADALATSRLVLAVDLWDKGEVAKAESLTAADANGDAREWEWHHVRGVFDSALWDADLTAAGGGGAPQWVYGLAVSPGGDWVAVAAWDPYQTLGPASDATLYLIRATDGRVERVWPHASRGWCCELAWQSDRRFVTRSSRNEFQVWDVAADRAVLTGPPSDAVPFRDSHLSPDGATGVVSVGRTDLIVWDAVRGAVGPRLSVPGRMLLAEGVGGGVAVCTDTENDLYCFDTATGELRFSRPGGGGLAAVGPDGTTLLTGLHAGRAASHAGIAAWDPRTGRRLWDRAARRDAVSVFKFSPDGRTIADLAHGTNDIRLWGAAGGEGGHRLYGHQGSVRSHAFSPDGRLLATAGDDRTARVWRAADGAPERVVHGHQSGVREVAFTRDAAGLITGGADGRVMLVDLTRPTPQHRTVGRSPLRDYYAPLFAAMAFTSDGRLRLADSLHGLADYDPETANPLTYRRVGTPNTRRNQREIIDWAFTPDGRRVVGPFQQTTSFLPNGPLSPFQAVEGGAMVVSPEVVIPRYGVAVWDGESGRELWRFTDLPGEVYATALSPDGATAAAYVNGLTPGNRLSATVIVWDLATGRERYRNAMPFPGAALAFSPDSRTLIASPGRMSKDVNIVGIDAATGGQTEWPASGGAVSVRSLVFSPDGSLLAGGCWLTGGVVVWDVAARAVKYRISAGVFTHLAFSPDGRRLAGTNYSGTVTLWDPATGREVYSLAGEPGRVMDYAHPARVAFSHDGRYVAANQHNGNVFVWEADARPPAERRVRSAAAALGSRYQFHLGAAIGSIGAGGLESALAFHLTRLRATPPPTPALRDEYEELIRRASR